MTPEQSKSIVYSRTLPVCPGVISRIAWSHDGTRIAAACLDGNCYVWEPQSGERAAVYGAHYSGASDVAWSPNDRLLVTCSFDKSLKFWDVDSKSCLHTLTGHRDSI